MITKVRVGGEEDHLIWERREQVRPTIRGVVRRVVGDESAYNHKFINMLLSNQDILELLESSNNNDDSYDKSNIGYEAGI